jgi:hypothetical protein
VTGLAESAPPEGASIDDVPRMAAERSPRTKRDRTGYDGPRCGEVSLARLAKCYTDEGRPR